MMPIPNQHITDIRQLCDPFIKFNIPVTAQKLYIYPKL